MKQRILFLSLLFLVLISCNSNNSNNSNKRITKDAFSISIIESYNAIQLFPAFIDANKILLKAKNDSILKHPSGNILLDKINQDTTQQGNSISDYPFWQVFIPEILQGNDGSSYVDTSSILGFSKINDTTKVLQYLHDKEISKSFPSDIDFIFTESGMMNGLLKIHGLKKNSKSIQLDNSSICKIFIKREGIAALLGGIAEKVEDLKGDSKYSIKLQLDNKVLSQLISDTYTIIIKVNDNVYSGSIVKSRISDLIFIGEIGNDILEVFKSEFKDKIIIE